MPNPLKVMEATETPLGHHVVFTDEVSLGAQITCPDCESPFNAVSRIPRPELPAISADIKWGDRHDRPWPVPVALEGGDDGADVYVCIPCRKFFGRVTILAHLLIGSVAEKVIRSVHCPVYVVRHPQRATVR